MNRTDAKAAVAPRQRLRLLDATRRILSRSDGFAAVEFAMILPFMLLLYLGSFEISEAIAVKRQVALTASTVANIVTQYASVSQTNDMPDILDASSTVLTPYPAAKAVVTVSLVTVDANGNATVTWSQCLNGTARQAGQAVTLPAGLNVPNSSVVMGETSYAYTPIMDFLHMGTLNLYSSVFMSPRSSSGTINLTP
ncbi:MAG: TadE/TadG family type IV pilus assembly protein [Rhizomicrobium sp.]|jgi:Flp pilus assembly protein TadG